MALTKVGLKGLDDGTDGQIITYDANGNPVAVGPGTDGQVLTSTGAGSPPAFEDAVSEGTQVKSTGESGGTKFLREDGDGTCSWQTVNVPAGVGGATGVDFNDSVKIRLGTDNDAELYHDGSHVYLYNNTGFTHITGSYVRINSPAGEQMIEAIADGAVHLKHDATTKFSTNANGISVAGNVGFVSSGDGIDFGATANGTTMASELFDDYEEGTWDPIARNGIASAAYTVQDGYYTKVGTLVHCTFTIQWGSGCTTNGGHIMLGNAPFTVASSPHDDKGMGLITYQNMESTGYGLYIHMSGARLDLYVGSTNAWTIANATDMNGKWIKGGFTYRAA